MKPVERLKCGNSFLKLFRSRPQVCEFRAKGSTSGNDHIYVPFLTIPMPVNISSGYTGDIEMFDAIRVHLQHAVPFAAHSGILLTELDDTGAVAQLPQTEFSVNHIATQHAGALFTLGETASGAAMAGIFAPLLSSIRPVTSGASINYVKVAKGRITAHAKGVENPALLLARFRQQGKVSFEVSVMLTDEGGNEVANMRVQWHVSDTSVGG